MPSTNHVWAGVRGVWWTDGVKNPTLATSRLLRRRWTPAADQARWVKDWEDREQTQMDFARSHGLSVGTLRDWLRGHRRNRKPERDLVELRELDIRKLIGPELAGRSMAWDAEIRLPGGVTIAVAREAPRPEYGNWWKRWDAEHRRNHTRLFGDRPGGFAGQLQSSLRPRCGSAAREPEVRPLVRGGQGSILTSRHLEDVFLVVPPRGGPIVEVCPMLPNC